MDVSDLKVLKNNLDIVVEWLSVNEINYQECEKIPRAQARRSIVLNKDLKARDIIKEEDIIMKRPWTWIWPEYLDLIVWRKINKDYNEDTILQFNYIV
jgi:N-acetylneuraminate synthase